MSGARVIAPEDGDHGDVHVDHPEHWDHGREHKHDRDVHPEIHGMKKSGSFLSADHPDDQGLQLFKEHMEAEGDFKKNPRNLKQLRTEARQRRATLRKERKDAKDARDAERHEEFEAKKREGRRVSAAAAAAEESEKHRARYAHRAQRLHQRRVKVAKMEVEPLAFNTESCGCGIHMHILGIPAIAARKLRLEEKQLRKMFSLFEAFDKDDSGNMSHSELIDLMQVPDTEFVRVMLDRVVFSAIEVKADHDIDFAEFVLACCVICTSSKQEMATTLFHVFDDDDSGFIDHTEMEKIIGFMRDTGANKALENVYNGILGTLKADGGTLYLDKFLTLSQRFPKMFDPIFRMRTALMEATLGKKAWAKLRKQYYRRAASLGQFHSFQQQIFMESDKIYEKHHRDLHPDLLKADSSIEEGDLGSGDDANDDDDPDGVADLVG